MLGAAAFLWGCDSASGPAAGSPEARGQIQAQKEEVQKLEDKLNAKLQKKKGQGQGALKIMKPGLNQGQPESQ
jgi:hypothetical protein